MKEFENRVAVVTDAASGIGRAMSKSFLEAGMKVVLAGIDAERLEGWKWILGVNVIKCGSRCRHLSQQGFHR